MKYIITEDQLTRLKRRVFEIDKFVELYLKYIYDPKFIENFFVKYHYPEYVYDLIESGIIGRMYNAHFSDLDDEGEEWKENYEMIQKYLETVWKDKIINHYTEIWEE